MYGKMVQIATHDVLKHIRPGLMGAADSTQEKPTAFRINTVC